MVLDVGLNRGIMTGKVQKKGDRCSCLRRSRDGLVETREVVTPAW